MDAQAGTGPGLKPGDLAVYTHKFSRQLFSSLDADAFRCGRVMPNDMVLVVAASHGYVMLLTSRTQFGWVPSADLYQVN